MRKASLIQQLRVILSAELDLLKTLELGTARGLVAALHCRGPARPTIDLDSVARTLDYDGPTETH